MYAPDVYHAGTHMNTKRIWWPKINPFVDYLSRVSFIFQEAGFVADVVYYYGDRIPNSVTPKNTHLKAGPGYDYEVINTEVLLNKLTVKDGKLVLSNGTVFSMLVLENEEEINPEVLARLDDLAERGAVIVGEKPKFVGKGEINSGITPQEMLTALDVPSDLDYPDYSSLLLFKEWNWSGKKIVDTNFREYSYPDFIE